MDSRKWRDKAFPLLISCQYLREDVDGLAKEVEAYIESRARRADFTRGAHVSRPEIL